MKPNAVILIVFLFFGGCQAAVYAGDKIGGKNGAVVGIIVWFVIFFLAVFLLKKRKNNKQRKLEKKTDEVIDYAKKSAAYHNQPDINSDYSERLKYIDEPEEKKVPETEPEYEMPLLTEEEFFKEYSDEFEKENQSFSKKINRIPDIREIMAWLWKKRKIFISIILTLLLIAGISLYGPNGIRNNLLTTILTHIREFIMSAAVMGFLYIVLRKYMPNNISNDSVVYKKMIPQEIKRHFGTNSSFDNIHGLPHDEIMRFNCFRNKITNISGKHLICGKYKNVDFRFAYEVIQHEYEYLDSDGDRCKGCEDLFRGFLVSLPYPKNSAYPLGVRSNSREEITELLQSENKSQKKTDVNISGTESVDFNTLFTINSVDEENLYYILTPDTMDKLSALYMYVYDPQKNPDRGHYSVMKNVFNCIYVYFEKNRLYIGLNSKFDLFAFKKSKPTAEEFKKLNNQISTALIVIERILDFALSLY